MTALKVTKQIKVTKLGVFVFVPQSDIMLRHYDKGPCRNKLGHSRASLFLHRTQVSAFKNVSPGSYLNLHFCCNRYLIITMVDENRIFGSNPKFLVCHKTTQKVQLYQLSN